MSELVILAIISSVTSVTTVIITGIINARANRKQNEQITDKVEKYHKEVNGNMQKMLITTQALGYAEGKAEEKEKNL